MSDDDSAAQRILALAGLLAIIGAAIVVTAYCSGCSAGPQFVTPTTPITITVQLHAIDGGSLEDCDVLIDRSSAESRPQTTGNDNRGARVDAQLPVNVSAAPAGVTP